MCLLMIILHQLEVIILKVITALVNPPMCFICHLLPATKQAILLMAALCLRLDSVQSNIVLGGFGGFGTGAGGAIGVFGCTGDSQKGASKPADSGSYAGVTNSGGSGVATNTTRTTESGLGYIVAGATYNVIDQEDTSGWIVDLNGRVKFDTASASRGLGSGKTDYAVQANVYKWLGEPTRVSYDNVVCGSLGGGYKFSKDTSFGASYNWATAAVDGARAQKCYQFMVRITPPIITN